MNCHSRWTPKFNTSRYILRASKHKSPHVNFFWGGTKNATRDVRKINQPDVDLNSCLGSVLLSSLHNEVMKQQVWAARSAWVDKPRREEKKRRDTAKLFNHTRSLLRAQFWSLVSKCLARLVKVTNNSPPTKQADEEFPVFLLLL